LRYYVWTSRFCFVAIASDWSGQCAARESIACPLIATKPTQLERIFLSTSHPIFPWINYQDPTIATTNVKNLVSSCLSNNVNSCESLQMITQRDYNELPPSKIEPVTPQLMNLNPSLNHLNLAQSWEPLLASLLISSLNQLSPSSSQSKISVVVPSSQTATSSFQDKLTPQ